METVLTLTLLKTNIEPDPCFENHGFTSELLILCDHQHIVVVMSVTSYRVCSFTLSASLTLCFLL